MKKIRPSEEKSKRFESLVNGEVKAENFVTELMRRGAEYLLQEILESEVSDFLSRGWYERKGRDNRENPGYRNGYLDREMRTVSGKLRVRRPRVRETEQPFESRVLSKIDRLEERLAKLTTELYVRGLSTRDIEEAVVDEDGKPLLSRNSVSKLTDELYAEYEGFSKRDLSSYDVVYLFIDAVYESVRKYTNNQPILCAWGICSDGQKVLLHIAIASTESADACEEFIEDMLSRGLREPLLIITDGGKGLKAAITKKFPHSQRQRCLAHKLRNLAVKLPQEVRDIILSQVKAVYYAPDKETAEILAEQFIERHSQEYPSLVKCFTEDIDACLTHLNYPVGHRKYIRTTNLLERSFVEEKRRTKIIPSHINERGAMKLVFGVLIRVARKWNRVKMTELELTQLRNIRKILAPNDAGSEKISFRSAA